MIRGLIPYLAYGFVSIVGWTSRLRWEGLEHLEALRASGRPSIYTFWHQRQVAFTYTHRGEPVRVFVSRSADGELIARTMALSGIPSVRGSSSRGAARAAREALELLDAGICVGITPDGPRGPARKVKPGVLYLAQASGCPILPLTSACSRRLELRRSWDRFHVPLPLSRLAVVYGEPLRVAEGDDLALRARELEERLDAITARADELVA